MILNKGRIPGLENPRRDIRKRSALRVERDTEQQQLGRSVESNPV